MYFTFRDTRQCISNNKIIIHQVGKNGIGEKLSTKMEGKGEIMGRIVDKGLEAENYDGKIEKMRFFQ